MTTAPQVEPGIDAETLFQKLGFKPHSQAQSAYLYSDIRFNVPCCGRRFGKSLTAGHRMTLKMFVPDTYNWIVAPTYKLGEKEFRVVYRDFEKLGLLKYCKKSYSLAQSDYRIETPWKTILEVVSAEKPDSLLGEGLSHVIMSESAKHNRATWEQYIQPALSDLRGSADFPSTPQGFNWYHAIWTLGQESGHKEYQSWSFPSWANTVRYPGGFEDEEIQQIMSTASASYFWQEYGAQFTALTGSIYDEWDENIHVTPLNYRSDIPNYLGIDFGLVNPTVALDIQVDNAENVYVWREYYSKYLSGMENAQTLRDRDNPKDYKVTQMWGDPSSADEIATFGLILGYVAAERVGWKQSVEQIKRLLKHDLPNGKKPHLFVDPSCVNLIREMGQLHVKPVSRNSKTDLNEQQTDGNIQHKIDDHCCDALRYFIGPHFVMGAGSHLQDLLGNDYVGSESHDLLTTLTGQSMTLDRELSLRFGL